MVEPLVMSIFGEQPVLNRSTFTVAIVKFKGLDVTDDDLSKLQPDPNCIDWLFIEKGERLD